MRCPPCSGSCNQGRTCPQFHTHEGLAVVNKGTGLHMPEDHADEPIIDVEGAAFWALTAGFGLVVVLAIVGVVAIVHFALR